MMKDEAAGAYIAATENLIQAAKRFRAALVSLGFVILACLFTPSHILWTAVGIDLLTFAAWLVWGRWFRKKAAKECSA